ncbi:MAG TPA: hypothetical protein VE081_02275, partial [Sporichthyaceae bacterium]|nr:hypothetical protein [Sporichthyaceae bacterium]
MGCLSDEPPAEDPVLPLQRTLKRVFGSRGVLNDLAQSLQAGRPSLQLNCPEDHLPLRVSGKKSNGFGRGDDPTRSLFRVLDVHSFPQHAFQPHGDLGPSAENAIPPGPVLRRLRNRASSARELKCAIRSSTPAWGFASAYSRPASAANPNPVRTMFPSPF